MNSIVVLGSSGQGKVIADIAVRNGYEDIVFLDDESVKECAGFSVIGKTCEAVKMSDDNIVAIGNPTIREKIQEELSDVVSLTRSSTVISRRVEIGESSVVMAGAVINSYMVIGKRCIINTGVLVDHDCILRDFVHVFVDSHLSGTVHVDERIWIGVGATVSNNINICDWCRHRSF